MPSSCTKTVLSFIRASEARPKEKQYQLHDKHGLCLRVYPNGTKKWVVRYTQNDRRRTETIGVFPELSIKDARLKAKAIQAERATDARCFDFVEKITLAMLFSEWIEVKATRIKDVQNIRKAFNKHLLPTLGSTPFNRIEPMHIKRVLAKAVRAGNYEICKRVCGWLGQLEKYAFISGYISQLHLQHLSLLFPRPVVTNMPSQPPEKLSWVLSQLMSDNLKYTRLNEMILFHYYTLLRPGEVLNMRWEWVDLTNRMISVPAEIMKAKRVHRIPISDQLLKLLNHIPRLADYMFPSLVNPGCRRTLNALSMYYKRRGLKGVMVPHGVRSVGRTWMAENGVDFYVAEACLAHSTGNATQQAYLRTDYLEQRREPMQAWSDFVTKCLPPYVINLVS